MVAITIRNIACLLGVASLGASVAVDTTKVDVDAAAWKMTELCE
jgi:hypothetical protein